jgi:hypothetical protein
MAFRVSLADESASNSELGKDLCLPSIKGVLHGAPSEAETGVD